MFAVSHSLKAGSRQPIYSLRFQYLHGLSSAAMLQNKEAIFEPYFQLNIENLFIGKCRLAASSELNRAGRKNSRRYYYRLIRQAMWPAIKTSPK
jgi:hypothetical protein